MFRSLGHDNREYRPLPSVDQSVWDRDPATSFVHHVNGVRVNLEVRKRKGGVADGGVRRERTPENPHRPVLPRSLGHQVPHRSVDTCSPIIRAPNSALLVVLTP